MPRTAPHAAVSPGGARPPGRRGVEAWRHHDGRTRCPPHPQAQARAPARAVPARAEDAPGRHQLQLPRVGRAHGLHRPWQGRPGLGPGRQRVHRPAPGLRPRDPRPRRRTRRRPRQRADAQGRQLLAHERGRDPGDGAPQGAQPVGRQGSHDRLGHRGDDARDAHRPGLHRPHEDREVRGPVPRRPRLRPDQRGAEQHGRPRRQRQPGGARLGPRDPVGDREDDHPRALQQHRLPAPAVRAPGRGDRRDHRRAGARERRGDPAPSRASTRRCGR